MYQLLPKLGGCGTASLAAAAAARPAALCVPAGAVWLLDRGTTRLCTGSPYGLLHEAARPHSSSLRAAATQAAASGRRQQQQHGDRQAQQAAAEDAFYAEEAQGFGDLGLAGALVTALQAAGFARPSRVQELVIPKVLSGKDIVLAAETGSGKTLAYIAPLSSLLLQKAASGPKPPSPDLLKAASDSSSSRDSGYRPKPRPQPGWMGLVLCPNTALCQQVVRLVSSLQDASGQPLLRAAHVSSSSPPPFQPPDVVVTTPGALKTLFNDRGASYGSDWTAEAVALRAAWVVVDEADLLWQGGYVKDLTRLLDAFKSAERRVLEAQVLQELQLERSCLERLPRKVKEALWKGGVPAMLKAGLTQPQIQRLREQQAEAPLQQHSRMPEQQQELAPDAEAAPSSSSSGGSSDLDRASSSSQASTSSGGDNNSSSSSSSGGGYGPYFSRQYLFVAATMPSLTKGDVGTELQKRFPGALWVSGDMLHQVKPHVDHTWVRLGSGGEAEVEEALLAAVQADPDYQAGCARVLVFTKNTANADRVSGFLAAAGVPNHVYHKNLPVKEAAAALEAMANPAPEHNLVMVSTDAAARGIDLPQVTHVIQADFVANAIEFLHRVGRTARAGRSGRVTSLYGPADAHLAEAVRAYVEAGEPVADCFSRNRSFSRKVKRYGKFVPRGKQGPQ